MKSQGTNCPACSSVNTQSVAMAYQNGTSSGTLSASSVGIGLNGSINVAATTGKTSNQTLLASRLMPPIKPVESLGLIFAVAGATFAVLFLIFNFGLAVLLALAASIGMFIFEHFRKKRKLPAYEKAVSQWQRHWLCNQCGNTWLKVR